MEKVEHIFWWMKGDAQNLMEKFKKKVIFMFIQVILTISYFVSYYIIFYLIIN